MQPSTPLNPQTQSSTVSSTAFSAVSRKDALLAYVYVLLKDKLKTMKLPELQELGIKSSIFGIFETNFYPDMILYELKEYLENEEALKRHSYAMIQAIEAKHSLLYK